MWIARDQDGDLILYLYEKPIKEAEQWNCNQVWEEMNHFPFANLQKDLFPELKWEDEPVEVEIIKK